MFIYLSKGPTFCSQGCWCNEKLRIFRINCYPLVFLDFIESCEYNKDTWIDDRSMAITAPKYTNYSTCSNFSLPALGDPGHAPSPICITESSEVYTKCTTSLTDWNKMTNRFSTGHGRQGEHTNLWARNRQMLILHLFHIISYTF